MDELGQMIREFREENDVINHRGIPIVPPGFEHMVIEENDDQARRREARERRDRARAVRVADRRREDAVILRHRDHGALQRAIRADLAQGRRFHRLRARQRHHRVVSEQGACTSCDMCNATPQLQDFMKHFQECPGAETASKKLKDMILHKFASSDYSLMRRLKKLRYDLEMNIYLAHCDPTQMANLDCSKCDTLQEHLDGGCITDNQSAVFEVKSAQIRSSIMAHFEQYLDIKKDIGMDEILEKHNNHFGSIEECFKDDAEDDETESRRQHMWYEFRRTTIDEQIAEKRAYILQTDAQNRRTYDMKLREVDDSIHSIASRMSREIYANRSYFVGGGVREMIRDARRQLNQTLSEDERRAVQERRRQNREANQGQENRLGENELENAAQPTPRIQEALPYGPVDNHDLMRQHVQDVLAQFDDSDDDVPARRNNGDNFWR